MKVGVKKKCQKKVDVCLENIHPKLCVMCHMSHVPCNLSDVTCHLKKTNIFFSLLKRGYSGRASWGGSVIDGANHI